MPAANVSRHKPPSPHPPIPPSAVLRRTTALYEAGRLGRRTDNAWCLLPGSPRFQLPKPSQVLLGLSATSSSAYGTDQPLLEVEVLEVEPNLSLRMLSMTCRAPEQQLRAGDIGISLEIHPVAY